MKYYLTSTRHCIENISSFKSLINRATKLIILPVNYHKDYLQCAEDVWNHFDRNPCNKESIFYETVRPFVDAGIDIDNIVVINLYADNINYVKYKLLLPNTIIYLGGGYPENIVENVLKYDLFMPYLSILKGDIEYKSDGMIEKIKQLLSDYNSRQSTRIANITQIYEMLSNIRTGDGSFEQGGKTGIGGLRAIARDIEILSKCMEYLPDELQMLIKDLYDKNFKLNTEFLTKKAAEMGIELPFEFVMPAPVDVLATDTNVNSKPKPTPNTNGN
jgi:hypothetical protein